MKREDEEVMPPRWMPAQHSNHVTKCKKWCHSHQVRMMQLLASCHMIHNLVQVASLVASRCSRTSSPPASACLLHSRRPFHGTCTLSHTPPTYPLQVLSVSRHGPTPRCSPRHPRRPPPPSCAASPPPTACCEARRGAFPPRPLSQRPRSPALPLQRGHHLWQPPHSDSTPAARRPRPGHQLVVTASCRPHRPRQLRPHSPPWMTPRQRAHSHPPPTSPHHHSRYRRHRGDAQFEAAALRRAGHTAGERARRLDFDTTEREAGESRKWESHRYVPPC